MKNKLTLIIDGNWLLQSRMAIIMDRFDKSTSEASRQAAQHELSDRLARSIIVTLNKIPTIDNIILVSDGGSWRKKLVKPVLARDITYKGNRKLNVEYDWDKIFQSLNELGERCQELGITYTRFLDVEGDDWCWYWSRRLNSEGTNCVIWSIDNDLKQLVQVDNGAFTGWYCNDKTGLYLHESLKTPELDDIDFFMSPSTESPILTSLKNSIGGSVTYINPSTIITDKIICGDGGDNIKSVVRYQSGSRVRRITEREWEKLARQYSINTIDDLNGEKEKQIINKLLERYNYVQDLNYKNLEDMIEYNKKLVWLNESVIPETIISKMNEFEYKQYDLSYIRSNYKVLIKNNEQDNIENLFEGIGL